MPLRDLIAALSNAVAARVRLAWMIGLVTALPAGSADGGAKDYRFPVDPYKSGPEATLRETPNMKLGVGAAPSLPRIIEMLKANRPPRFRLQTVALFGGSRNVQYLAVEWGGQTEQTPVVEFHKLVTSAEGVKRLYFMRDFRDRFAVIQPPTGVTVFRDEPAIAVVFLGSGGSGLWGYKLRLIQMARNTVDITPDWAGRIVDVVDLDGDGQFEVVAIDGRWAGFFDGRGSAGPHLPIVLERKNRLFVPACNGYAEIYRREVDLYERYAAERSAPDPWKAEFLASALLSAAQIGAFSEADRLLSALKAVYDDQTWEPTAAKAPIVIAEFSRVLADAKRYRASACAASATDSRGGHYGFIRRAEHFRFDK